jgi:hypothetical protein
MTVTGDVHRVIEGAFSHVPNLPISGIDIFVFDTPSVDSNASVNEYSSWFEGQLFAIEKLRAPDAVLILLPTDRKGHPWSKSAASSVAATLYDWQLFRHFVWLKQEADFHRAQYAFQDVWTFRKGNRATNDIAPARYKDVVRILMPHDDDSHVGALPSTVIEYFLALFVREDDVVMDPFAGRGSVMEACHTLGLRSVSVELDSERAEHLRQMSRALEGENDGK